jgi:hypothetical protein
MQQIILLMQKIKNFKKLSMNTFFQKEQNVFNILYKKHKF